MALPKRYDPTICEPKLMEFWQSSGVYHFSPEDGGEVYSIDTPPPTVSGKLHLGHVYSYSHPDFLARFWRMKGHKVFYPMGYDDNGLPTERLVEQTLKIRATEVGRESFIEQCLEVSRDAENEYERLWQRLGLSIDWRYTYRTIDTLPRRISQIAFVDLYEKELAYRKEAPTIWCPSCNTAIAQAELSDLDRESEFVTLAFHREDGEVLQIATTRPELLPACVAVFVHPDDQRYRTLVGQTVVVPFFEQKVPVMEDPGADPEKGTGAVMCCTFGDVTDVAWWHKHSLPLVTAITPNGRMTDEAGEFSGLSMKEARRLIMERLDASGLVMHREPVMQSVRVHERCDTPVEYTVARQWFIRVLDFKEKFREAGENITWHPDHMKARYHAWLENLHWDWCISRQRYFGIPFPLWYCDECGGTMLAERDDLPVDPVVSSPRSACPCGSTSFTPEHDVMDTWATSSLTPQIVSQWLHDETLFNRVFPMSLRPQGHEIIRTWAFYTIVRAEHHFGMLPWERVVISGWGLAPEGTGKISKSRGGGPMAPVEMIRRYSADAVRYWAASTGFGRDSVISEEKIRVGSRLVTKLWNVARFSERFLEGYRPLERPSALSPADAWILSRLQRLIARATESFETYDFVSVKSDTESFLWTDLADNYLEMAKQRLYNEAHPFRLGAQYTLYHVLLGILKLFAPFIPYVTEEIYLHMFASKEGRRSIHVALWPGVDESLIDETAESVGSCLIEIATAVRRYKTEESLPMGSEIQLLEIASENQAVVRALGAAVSDITSVTRSKEVRIVAHLRPDLLPLASEGDVTVALKPQDEEHQVPEERAPEQ